MEQLARGWSRKSDLASMSTFTLPLNKTLDHRVPAAHRDKRGCEKGGERERKRGEEDRWAKRKDHRYIKERSTVERRSNALRETCEVAFIVVQ